MYIESKSVVYLYDLNRLNSIIVKITIVIKISHCLAIPWKTLQNNNQYIII